ncbi:hypothetical protein EPI10_004962 [Gossypium australe]|uniref:Uncharacterized protein n=1 Tax=Gossypium australe TaxID=47621 RepID=A0A5B6WLM6_9ROSI|nr:hypothetical protein EPI10_004962 [Gossypium australe]
MIDVGLILQDLEKMSKGVKSYCEFHSKEGHEIQECVEFRALVQSLMDKKEIEFFEDVKGLEGEDVNRPVEIILRPRSNEAGTQVVPRFIIQKPVAFPYKDSKRVLWNYDCNVMTPGEDNSVNTSEEGHYIGFFMRSGRHYDPTSARTEPIKGKTLAVEHKK